MLPTQDTVSASVPAHPGSVAITNPLEDNTKNMAEPPTTGCYDELFSKLESSFPIQDLKSVPASEVYQYAADLNKQIIKHIEAAQKVEKKLKVLGDHYLLDKTVIDNDTHRATIHPTQVRGQNFLRSLQTPVAVRAIARPHTAFDNRHMGNHHVGSLDTSSQQGIIATSLIGRMPVPSSSASKRFRVIEQPTTPAAISRLKVRGWAVMN
jgi:hypothetical protein